MDVHKQNKKIKEVIRETALSYKNKEVPKYLQDVLLKENIDVNLFVLVSYNFDVQSFGKNCKIVDFRILDNNKNFWDLEIEYNTYTEELIEYQIVNVSDTIEIAQHKKGVYQTWGYLACEVLKELNEGIE